MCTRCEAPDQAATQPQVQPYLQEGDRHSYDIQLSVELTPADSETATVITRSNFKHLYMPHHASVTDQCEA